MIWKTFSTCRIVIYAPRTTSAAQVNGSFALNASRGACLLERPRGHCDAMSAEQDRAPVSSDVSHADSEVGPNAQHPPASARPDVIWARIRRHKVVEWTLAYVAFGYALLHGVQIRTVKRTLARRARGGCRFDLWPVTLAATLRSRSRTGCSGSPRSFTPRLSRPSMAQVLRWVRS